MLELVKFGNGLGEAVKSKDVCICFALASEDLLVPVGERLNTG